MKEQGFPPGSPVLIAYVGQEAWQATLSSSPTDISWDEMHKAKSEAGFADRWAVEIFPPQESLVNVANMRHIWLMESAPAFAWRLT